MRAELLQKLDYRLDTDAWLAREDLEKFWLELNVVFDRRRETMLYFVRHEKWDVLMFHFMETDRLMHFMIDQFEKGEEPWKSRFLEFFGRVDKLIGRLDEDVPEGDNLIILSDHGFTPLKYEVYPNRVLYDNGLLKFKSWPPKSIMDIAEGTMAFVMDPARSGSAPGNEAPSPPSAPRAQSYGLGALSVVRNSSPRMVDPFGLVPIPGTPMEIMEELWRWCIERPIWECQRRLY